MVDTTCKCRRARPGRAPGGAGSACRRARHLPRLEGVGRPAIDRVVEGPEAAFGWTRCRPSRSLNSANAARSSSHRCSRIASRDQRPPRARRARDPRRSASRPGGHPVVAVVVRRRVRRRRRRGIAGRRWPRCGVGLVERQRVGAERAAEQPPLPGEVPLDHRPDVAARTRGRPSTAGGGRARRRRRGSCRSASPTGRRSQCSAASLRARCAASSGGGSAAGIGVGVLPPGPVLEVAARAVVPAERVHRVRAAPAEQPRAPGDGAVHARCRGLVPHRVGGDVQRAHGGVRGTGRACPPRSGAARPRSARPPRRTRAAARPRRAPARRRRDALRAPGTTARGRAARARRRAAAPPATATSKSACGESQRRASTTASVAPAGVSPAIVAAGLVSRNPPASSAIALPRQCSGLSWKYVADRHRLGPDVAVAPPALAGDAAVGEEELDARRRRPPQDPHARAPPAGAARPPPRAGRAPSPSSASRIS